MVHIRADMSLAPVWQGVHISELALCLIALLALVYIRYKGEGGTLLLRWLAVVSCFGALQAFFWLLVPQDTVDALWVVAAWSESMFFSAAFALQVYLLFYCFASTSRLEVSSYQLFSRLKPLFLLLIILEVGLDVCIRALFTKLSFSADLEGDQAQQTYNDLTIAQYSMYSVFELGMAVGTYVDIRRMQRLRSLLSGARTTGALSVSLVLRQLVWTGLLGLSFTLMSWAQVFLWFVVYDATNTPAEAITTLILEAFRHYAIYCHLLFTLVNLSVLLNKSDLAQTPLLTSVTRESELDSSTSHESM